MAEKGKPTLEEAIASLNKSIGENIVYEYGSFNPPARDRISTGSISLDYITGGGWVRGTLNQLTGWESSGKSTVALLTIREYQKQGLRCLYVDAEHAFDKAYAESLGVDVNKLIVSQPDCIEDAYQIIIDLVETGEIGLAIMDSIAAAVTRKELEGDIGESSLGVKAKINSQAFPKFAPLFNKTKTTGLFVNQYREKIGVSYGSPVTEPGGNAMRYYMSIKLELSRSTQIKDGEEVIGNLFKAKCVKNKTAAPYKEAVYTIEYGKGIIRELEVFDFAVQFGIIEKAGSWYSFAGEKLGQGTEKALMKLMENDRKLYDEVEATLISAL